jgi:hypothetical protein
VKQWLVKGPFNKLIVTFLLSRKIRWYQKMSLVACAPIPPGPKLSAAAALLVPTGS